jgi:dihydrofolate reductase
MAENRAIGIDNSLPWHLPADLKRFKALTLGHPMIMGRLTFESIGKPLPGRTSIVVTRNKAWTCDGVHVCGSIEEAIKTARDIAEADGLDTIMVVGGAEIYRQTLGLASRLYVTEIHKMVEGDAFFPELDTAVWREHSRERLEPESDTVPACSFVEYRRR